MTPEKPQKSPSPDLFRNRLDNMLNHRHELYRLADLIDWSTFDAEFGRLYCPDNGCPAKATRLMVGLQYLKHLYGLSDEAVVRRWVENPYWQYFCGAVYFEHQLPIDPSSMTRFRRRIGESGCELILQATVAAGLNSKTIKPGQPEKQAIFAEELALAKRVLVQQKQDKNKLYSLHAPEVECLSKGKAHKRYEFGVKASIATTNKSNFVVGGMALPGITCA